MSRPFDPLFLEEEVQDAINNYYGDMSSNEDDILSRLIVGENNSQEFINIISDYIKFDLLLSHQHLNQFTFKGENVERFNTEFWNSCYPEKDSNYSQYPYMQQHRNKPFQHPS